MVTDDLASTDFAAEPESMGPRSRFHSPRFARLVVGSPAARRFSPRRSVVALLVGIGCLSVGVFALNRCGLALAAWVAHQPEHQISFEAIELIPPAPGFVPMGSATILESVRLDARYGPTISVLGIDLDTLRVDLRRNPWIEDVKQVRRSYRHLAVEVAYRQPLALIVYPNDKHCAIVDRQGVELPVEPDLLQLVKAGNQVYYHVAGDGNRLIEIKRLGYGQPGRVGLAWKSDDPAIDENKVAQALRLAQWLHDAGPKTPNGLPIPSLSLYYHAEAIDNPDGSPELIKGFFLRDPDQRWIFWGSGPGSEARDEPKASEKWAALLKSLDTVGPLKSQLDSSHYLSLRSRKPVILKVKTDPKGRVGTISTR